MRSEIRIDNFLNTTIRTDRTEGNGEGEVFGVVEDKGQPHVSTCMCHLKVDDDTLVSKRVIDVLFNFDS
jgi:hypothetical protein